MNKTAVKNFAVQARITLIKAVKQKAYEYDITPDAAPGAADVLTTAAGRILTETEKEQREQLINSIVEKGYEQVMEEAAYTWFNRFIALRFMEVNGYLPSRVRIFTDEDNNFEPQILKEALDLDIEGLDMNRVYELKSADDEEALYKYLFITQCNALSSILPGMFQKIEDCTELLLPDRLLSKGSVIDQMVTSIPEEDWKDEVQIIGWLYQYYISEKKDEVFAALKKNIKITKENIPAATQLFTPDWIVRYMVENSLGRLWIEGHPDCKSQLLPDEEEKKAYLAYRNLLNVVTEDEGTESEQYAEKYDADNDRKWHYYLEEAEQEPEVQAKLDEIRKGYAAMTPEQLKVIDPCCGSGHILAYMFDMLVQIYETNGYTKREAVSSIIQNNLYGLDIDERAAQLAYFAVMMKGCQYDRRFLTRGVQPHVYAIEESNTVKREQLSCLGAGLSDIEKNAARMQAEGLIADLKGAKEYGSILTVKSCDWDLLRRYADNIDADGQISMEYIGIDDTVKQLKKLINVGEVMAQKYDAVVTNPPYMGASGMGAGLSKYVKERYPDSKSDLFAVFLEHGNDMVKINGFNCMVTMQSWMFLSSFEKLRKKLLNEKTITTLMHMENMVMGIAFGTAVTVFRNSKISAYKGTYNQIKLDDIEDNIPKEFPVRKNRFSHVSTDNFSKIPGSPVAYWVSDSFSENFGKPRFGDKAEVITGMTIGDNNLYLRLWHEVEYNKSIFNATSMRSIDISRTYWIPYSKGGPRRNWYGNYEYLVNWSKKDNFNRSKTTLQHLYLRDGITWPFITSGGFSARILPNGFLWDVAGSPCFFNDENMKLYALGAMCSNSVNYILSVVNPTINVQAIDVAHLPLPDISDWQQNNILTLVRENLLISKFDWDSYEISWDFRRNPLI